MLSGFDFHFDENEDFFEVRDVISDAQVNMLAPEAKEEYLKIINKRKGLSEARKVVRSVLRGIK